LFFGLLLLYLQKGQAFPTWEPTAFQDGVAPTVILLVAWMVAIGLLTWLCGQQAIDTLDSEHLQDKPATESAPSVTPTTPAPAWLTAVSTLIVVSAITLTVGMVVPQFIGTPTQAVAKEVGKDRPGQHSGLLSVLWTQTAPHETEWRRISPDRLEAHVTFLALVSPFEVDADQAGTRQAAGAFFDRGDQVNVTVTDIFELERTGLGWTVVSQTRNREPVARLKAYAAGALAGAESTLALPPDPVGVGWMPFMPIAALMTLLPCIIAGVALLGSFGRGGKLTAAGASAFSLLQHGLIMLLLA
jgi:hypothetical protein